VSWTRNADIATVGWLRPFFDDQSDALDVRELSSVAIGHLADGFRIFAQHYCSRYRICDGSFHGFHTGSVEDTSPVELTFRARKPNTSITAHMTRGRLTLGLA
jgi:hypothetical protein